jgi:hypothetical protein
MPPVVFLVLMVRRVRTAFQATGQLADSRVRHAIPWRYVRRAWRHHRWLAVVAFTLAVSFLGVVVAVAAPVRQAGLAAGWTAFAVSWLGVSSAWVRRHHELRKIRR